MGNTIVQPKPARQILLDALQKWGIDTRNSGPNSLGALVDKYVKAGIFGQNTNADTVQLYLQDTKEWKTRFAGIEALRKNYPDVPVPSIAEYLATERSMAQVMQAAGLPKGFYDSPADFAQFIGNNVSPTELNQRVQDATTAAQNLDPGFRNYLKQAGYGDLTLSHLASYMLDPKRAEPLITRDLEAAKVAGAASTHGFNLTNSAAQQIQSMGLTEYQLRSGLDTAAQTYTQANRLGNIYKSPYTQQDALSEFLGGSKNEFDKRMALVDKEKSNFSGSVGAAPGSFAQDIGGY